MSQASTIPATEAQLAAARKLPRPSVEDSGLSTPQDKILRRQNTQVLPGHIGDTHLLATAAAKQQPVEVSKKGKVKSKPARSVKKKQPKNAKQGKRGKKASGGKKSVIKKQKTQKETMPTAPTEKAPAKGAPSQQPGSAATAPQPPAPRPACKKAAAKKAVVRDTTNVPPAQPVKIEPKSERIRRKHEVQTPPSVREARGVAQAQLDNMGRSTTYEQFASPVPSTQNATNKESSNLEPGPNHDDDEHLSDATSYYEPSEQEEEEDEDEREDELEESESEDEPGQPDESNAAPTPTPTQKGKGKKAKKPKTPEQKAAHARYMKFSRSLRSTFAAA